jgi:hypothetical protein
MKTRTCAALLALFATFGVPVLHAQDKKIQAEVTYLMDRQQIADTLQKYIRGIDRHDKDLARSAFWPEARINMGGEPQALDEYVNDEEGLLATYLAHQHHITGQTVEIQGNTAHVESYVLFLALPHNVAEKTEVGSGRYIERWEKRKGEWKILVREYVHDLTVHAETVDYCATRPCVGRWDREDLSYVRPLQPLTAEQRRARAEASKKVRETDAP